MSSSEPLPNGNEIVWEPPPVSRGSKGRHPNPNYDSIAYELSKRPGTFALVATYPTYGKAVNVLQLLQNRGCYATTRKHPDRTAVDLYAMWPAEAEIEPDKKEGDVWVLVWQNPPKKQRGIQQNWERDLLE